MITREHNSQRKSLRVAIPLFVEMGGATYEVRNWSTTGLGIVGLAPVPAQGEVVDARISFPMLESTLVIPVRLAYRAGHGEVAGFDFHDLSARNKRVLRHYIELSVDGKLGDVEDIVAISALPVSQTPVDRPLNLPSHGAPATLGQFRTRSWGAMALGIAVLGLLGGVLFYNLAYKVEGTGFVSGSIARITANHDGRVGRMLVQPNTRVEANTPLFSVENPALKNEIEALEQHVAQLAAEQGKLSGARRQAEASVLSTLRRDWQQRESELANARRLYENGIISQRDMLMVSNNASEVQHSYLRQVAEGANRTLSLENSDVLNKLRLDLAAKKMLLARQDAERIVRSPGRGKVFHIDKGAGEYVSAQDPVVLLEADITPSVLLRLPNDDALKLKLGMPATIYVPFEDRKYSATVTAVGLSAVNANSPATLEGGLNETLVKLDFDDRRVRLPANARVNVWVRSLSSYFS